MKKPLSPATKFKIKLFTVYIASIIFCIFWLVAEVNITKRVKQDRISSEENISLAISAIEKYLEAGDTKQLEIAGHELLRLYSTAAVNSEGGSVLTSIRSGYPGLKAKELSYLGSIGGVMLANPEATKPYAVELKTALTLIKSDISSKRRALSEKTSESLRKLSEEILGSESY